MPSFFELLTAPGRFLINRFRKSTGALTGLQAPSLQGQNPQVLNPELPLAPILPPEQPATNIPSAPPAQAPQQAPTVAPKPPSLGVGMEAPAGDAFSALLTQFQNLTPEQKQLFGIGETAEQKTQREAMQNSLDRLITLQSQLTTAGAPTQAMQELDRLIGEQQLALRQLQPERVLAERPGILGQGVTEAGFAGRLAKEQEPIARTYADLLTSRSILAQQQQQQFAGLQAQAGAIGTELELRQALAALGKPTALPSAVQTELFKALVPSAPKTQVTEAGGRKLLINSQTGATIKDLGEARMPKTTIQKPLSGDAAKVLSIATTMVPEINQLKAEFEKNYKGAVAGIVSGTDRRLAKLVDQVADKVGRLRSGGAVNKDEEARFKRQIASTADLLFGRKETAIAALDGLITEANQVASGIKPETITMDIPNIEELESLYQQLNQ